MKITAWSGGAVVTGGGQGIGAAIATRLASAGAPLLVAGRTQSKLDAMVQRLRDAGHDAAWAVACDVTDPAGVQALARAAAAHLGEVKILINNAGGATSAPVQQTTLEDWQRMFAINATSTFLCTQAFLPGMLERGFGRIVNIASVAGLQGGRYISAYTAAKHAVVGFTKAVAAEVADRGVTVNAVCPGYVDTPMTADTVARVSARTGKPAAAALAAVLASSGQPRLVTPEEVAEVVVALCHEDGPPLNGQTLVLDGGATRP